jgi:hypothetical protein
MEDRQTFDHAEMEPASGSVSIPSPGFPITKPERYNFIFWFPDNMTHAAV